MMIPFIENLHKRLSCNLMFFKRGAHSGIKISDCILRTITEKDLKTVEDFFAENFSAQNPLRQIFRVNPEIAFRIDKKRLETYIGEGFSFGAFIKQTGEPVAFQINTLVQSEAEMQEYQREWENLNEEAKSMNEFVRFMAANVFKELKAKKIYWMIMGTVGKKFRNSGLSSLATAPCKQVAESNGCEYMATVITSRFSQRHYTASGFSTLKVMRYDDYVDQKTGKKPLLNLSPIHTEAYLMYKAVN